MSGLLFKGGLHNNPQTLNPDFSFSSLHGVGCFETLRFQQGKILEFDRHYDRLLRGLHFFQLQKNIIPVKTDLYYLLQSTANHFNPTGCKIKFLTSVHAPDQADFYIDISPLPEKKHHPLSVMISKKYAINISEHHSLKLNNRLIYTLSSFEASINNVDECILLNQHSHICDATISNVFMFVGNVLFTPNLTEGCIAGVFRDKLIEKLLKENIEVHETFISQEMLLNADEIFLTNAIRGIRPVSLINGIAKISEKTNNLIKLFPQYY